MKGSFQRCCEPTNWPNGKLCFMNRSGSKLWKIGCTLSADKPKQFHNRSEKPCAMPCSHAARFQGPRQHASTRLKRHSHGTVQAMGLRNGLSLTALTQPLLHHGSTLLLLRTQIWMSSFPLKAGLLERPPSGTSHLEM